MIDWITLEKIERKMAFRSAPLSLHDWLRLPTLRGSAAKCIEHGVSPVADGPNACNPAIPHTALIARQRDPIHFALALTPRQGHVDSSLFTRLLSLTAHDLAWWDSRPDKDVSTRSSGPILAPESLFFAQSSRTPLDPRACARKTKKTDEILCLRWLDRLLHNHRSMFLPVRLRACLDFCRREQISSPFFLSFFFSFLFLISFALV